MCFSATASFAAAGLLVPAGAYTITQALRKDRGSLALAAVPLLFGIQQFAEGWVWRGLDHNDPHLIRRASLVFLFFALAFWPFWFPFLATVSEPQKRRRRILAAMTLLSTVWFWILYFPLVAGPASLLTTRVEHHSIQYAFPDLVVYELIPRQILRLLYFACVAIPIVMQSGGGTMPRMMGYLLGGSALLSAVVYHYAFVSVWCFFAAIQALYLVLYYARLR